MYLRFWNSAGLIAPFLCLLLPFLARLAISEASVERGFATMNDIITEHRLGLHDSTVERLLFLNRHSRVNVYVAEYLPTIFLPSI